MGLKCQLIGSQPVGYLQTLKLLASGPLNVSYNSRVSSNPLTRRKIFAEMVVTDLFDEGLHVTSIFDKKTLLFQMIFMEFGKVWSLIQMSKPRWENTLIFLTCVVFDIEITIVIFSSLSFLLQLINYAMTTLLFSDRHGITIIPMFFIP